jgi:predicted Zn-dependent peptidase
VLLPNKSLVLYFLCYALVLIDAGSRYEVDHPSGVSHVIEKIAFKVSHDRSVRVSTIIQCELTITQSFNI